MWWHDLSTDLGAMTTGESGLEGRRVLIVEDSPVVGPFTADLLEDLGYVALGPAPTLAAARELISSGNFDVAIVDVHIRGERVFPLCETLEQQGIPFVLTSGYADWQVPEQWSERPRLHKPYGLEGLRDALRTALAP
jgi:CheY-like chemotaxis protein